MLQGRCSGRDRKGEGDATAPLRQEARRRGGAALRSCHLAMRAEESATRRRRSRTREGEKVARRGRSCCFERDGVGKPERGLLRHMLPHCNWGSDYGEQVDRDSDEDWARLRVGGMDEHSCVARRR
jgi:hypothetical protein